MEEITQLIKDYKRRIVKTKESQEDCSVLDRYNELAVKIFCYRTFVSELENIRKQIEINK